MIGIGDVGPRVWFLLVLSLCIVATSYCDSFVFLLLRKEYIGDGPDIVDVVGAWSRGCLEAFEPEGQFCFLSFHEGFGL